MVIWYTALRWNQGKRKGFPRKWWQKPTAHGPCRTTCSESCSATSSRRITNSYKRKKRASQHALSPSCNWIWWAIVDSNYWPLPCQGSALTNWANSPQVAHSISFLFEGCQWRKSKRHMPRKIRGFTHISTPLIFCPCLYFQPFLVLISLLWEK